MLLIDIETSSLDVENCEIFCIVCLDYATKKIFTFSSDTSICGEFPLSKLSSLVERYTYVIAHNGVSFDFRILQRLGIKPKKIRDTLLDSKLVCPKDLLQFQDSNNPQMPPKYTGSYSLKAWGYRLGVYKGEYEDFSKLTPEMLEYCIQDVKVLDVLFSRLHYSKFLPSYNVLLNEYRVAYLIKEQEHYGMHFDIYKANKLAEFLELKLKSIENKVYKIFPPKYVANGDIVVPKKITKSKVGPYQKIKLQAFNLNSRKQIEEKLAELNYKFDTFTKTGRAKINEETIGGTELGDLISKYLKTAKDYSQLKGGDNSIISLFNEKTHRIHGKADTLGANTHRFTHRLPNITQIPKTKEFRSLFTITNDDYVFIGIDADALELMMLGYYLSKYDDGEYLKSVALGSKEEGNDVHTITQRITNLPTRDLAKTFTYATLYGSGILKLGIQLLHEDLEFEYTPEEYKDIEKQLLKKVIKSNSKELFELDDSTYIEWNPFLIKQALYGKKARDNFFQNTKGINDLIRLLEFQYETYNRIISLDKRFIFASSKHKCLNMLLQSSGAIFMKYYLLNVFQALCKKYKLNKDYGFICNIHDAIGIEAKKTIAEDIANDLEQAFSTTSKQFGFQYDVKGKAHIANNLYDIY